MTKDSHDSPEKKDETEEEEEVRDESRRARQRFAVDQTVSLSLSLSLPMLLLSHSAKSLVTAYVVFSVSNSSRSFPFYSRGKSETSSSATSLTTARNAQQTMVISYELIGKRNQNTTEFVEPLFLERKKTKQKK